MSGHTPGPWKNFGAGKGVGIAAHPKGRDQPEWIAVVYGPGVNAESAANVNLLTAAPELLEAAKYSLRVGYGAEDCDSCHWCELRAAIAKAEGHE